MDKQPLKNRSRFYAVPLPISMHTGQIILMAKMFAEIDLGFYDFTDTKGALSWKSVP